MALFEVQSEELGQEISIGNVDREAIRFGDGGIEPSVRVAEPRWTFVVEIRKSAFGERARQGGMRNGSDVMRFGDRA